MKEKLISDLRKFGLSECEARSYLALTVHGPLTAAEISRHAEVPRTKVYDIVHKLQGRVLIEVWSARPRKYRAIEPVFALKKMIEEKQNHLKILEAHSSDILNKLQQSANNGYSIWASKGKRAFLEKACEMVARTSKLGCATTSSFSRCQELDNAFLEALRRGVEIRMLGVNSLDNASNVRAKWYLAQGASVKILPMDVHPVIGIGDEREVCIRVDNALESDFVWSNNPALVNIIKSYFNSLWKQGKELSTIS